MSGFAEDPRASYSAFMGKAEFFAWLQAQEGGRFELKDGDIVVHAGSSRRHAWLSARLLTALSNRLDPDRWLVLAADFAVEVGNNIRYPDVVVDTVAENPKAMSTATPALAIEVHSPSSAARDMVEKLGEYTSLPSLQAYIVASQDEPLVWVWQRDAVTGAFPPLPREISGSDGAVVIDALGVTLPLGEIYRGIVGA